MESIRSVRRCAYSASRPNRYRFDKLPIDGVDNGNSGIAGLTANLAMPRRTVQSKRGVDSARAALMQWRPRLGIRLERWPRRARGDSREGSGERGKSGENASQVDRLRAAAAGETLRGVSHLLLLRHADRSLGKNRSRKNHARKNSRVHRRAAQDRTRLAARADCFLVRDRQRLALAVASVRAPSDRNQLRAAEPALREIQAGQARIRAAGFVGARGTRR